MSKRARDDDDEFQHDLNELESLFDGAEATDAPDEGGEAMEFCVTFPFASIFTGITATCCKIATDLLFDVTKDGITLIIPPTSLNSTSAVYVDIPLAKFTRFVLTKERYTFSLLHEEVARLSRFSRKASAITIMQHKKSAFHPHAESNIHVHMSCKRKEKHIVFFSQRMSLKDTDNDDVELPIHNDVPFRLATTFDGSSFVQSMRDLMNTNGTAVNVTGGTDQLRLSVRKDNSDESMASNTIYLHPDSGVGDALRTRIKLSVEMLKRLTKFSAGTTTVTWYFDERLDHPELPNCRLVFTIGDPRTPDTPLATTNVYCNEQHALD